MKQTLNIQLKMSEIIFDIQNKTYLTGRSAANGNPTNHIANMQANDDDENAAQILRSVTTANAILRNRLCEYLKSEDNAAGNESLTATDDISISLDLPSNFNPGVSKTIGEAAHQFIVASAIADWFAITAKGETADYTLVADRSMAVIEEALCKRKRPQRP